ncbi:MAG: hypothetical protein ACE10K_16090, partial [Rhodothermales bacterium]
AVALYPYREEEPGLFEKSRHRRMLDEIGVGAIPLLPGETMHLEAWLGDVLKEGWLPGIGKWDTSKATDEVNRNL